MRKLGLSQDTGQGQEVLTHLERQTESPSSLEVSEVPEGSEGGTGKEREVCDVPGGPPCRERLFSFLLFCRLGN